MLKCVRSTGRRLRARLGWRAAALLALLAASAVRVRVRDELAGAVRAAPHALAVHLADFNNLRAFNPQIESWWIEQQWNNYTTWRYTARFTCGARCAGRAAVASHDRYAPARAGAGEGEGAGAGVGEGAPAHGARALSYLVNVEISSCWTLPLLPWPAFCDDTSVESEVVGDGAGGARYAERAAARGALAGALAGRGAALRRERRRHLQSLRDAFA